MDGFKRPNRPIAPPPVVSAPPVSPAAVPNVSPEPLAAPLPDLTLPVATPAQKKRHWLRTVLIGTLAMVAVTLGLVVTWYQNSLQPVNKNDTNGQDFSVTAGQTLAEVATGLQQKGLIQNSVSFQIYARLNNLSSVVAGNCVVKASQTVHEIATKLAAGCNEYKSIMFYPGATIEKPLYMPDSADFSQTMYVKYVLSQAGYTSQQITDALNKQYTGPLFADKPAGTTLEGYVYGQTYHLGVNATAEQALQAAFDQMYQDITANDLVNKFKARGLNLYQGITLASIVQRELNCEGKPTEERKQRCYGYQQTIAQVFLKRLTEGDMLGSDVTFIYAADMRGVAPTVDIDSPYNTRINAGLPPGPIAAPGLLALMAVGNPSDTDYHYFVAGDDGLIYFARTQAEHETNIVKYCQILCNEL